LYNNDYNDNLTIEDITQWGLNVLVKEECGLKIYDYLARPDFYDHVLPIEGAIEGISKLEEAGFKLFYVSTCVPETMDQKMRWMIKNVPSFNWKQTVFTHEKALIDVDALIDDGPHNLLAMPGYVSTIRFDQPYNRDTPANAHTRTWHNMVETVKEALNTRQRYRNNGKEVVHVG
jgi:5'(3')-deoxyribonucleotidase